MHWANHFENNRGFYGFIFGLAFAMFLFVLIPPFESVSQDTEKCTDTTKSVGVIKDFEIQNTPYTGIFGGVRTSCIVEYYNGTKQSFGQFDFICSDLRTNLSILETYYCKRNSFSYELGLTDKPQNVKGVVE